MPSAVWGNAGSHFDHTLSLHTESITHPLPMPSASPRAGSAGSDFLQSLMDDAVLNTAEPLRPPASIAAGGGSMTSRRASATAMDGSGLMPLRFPSNTLQQSPLRPPPGRASSRLTLLPEASPATDAAPAGGEAAALPEPAAGGTGVGAGGGSTGGGGGIMFPQKASLAALCDIFRQFSALYGPVVVLLENLHDFDTWSWQLLVKLSEELSGSCLVIATTRPNNAESAPAPGAMGAELSPGHHHLQSKAAMYARVATLYRQLLTLDSTISIKLCPFTFEQTRELMKVGSSISCIDEGGHSLFPCEDTLGILTSASNASTASTASTAVYCCSDCRRKRPTARLRPCHHGEDRGYAVVH